MKFPAMPLGLTAMLLIISGAFIGCESTDSGSTHVSSNVYYGVGFYDPWYYGDYHDDDYVVVSPPPGSPGSPPGARPPIGEGPRPSHPIARPPAAAPRPPVASPRPAVRPMPSIPSTPRAAPRGGGGGRRR